MKSKINEIFIPAPCGRIHAKYTKNSKTETEKIKSDLDQYEGFSFCLGISKILI